MLSRPERLKTLTESDIEALEIGSAILGTGGGGNPYIGKLRARQALREGYPMRLISLEASQYIQLTTILTFIVSSYLVVYKYPTPIGVEDDLMKD